MLARAIAVIVCCVAVSRCSAPASRVGTDSDSGAPARTESEGAKQWRTELEELRRKDPPQFLRQQRTLTVAGSMMLGQLGYLMGPFSDEPNPALTEAVREFEKARGLLPTGEITSSDTFKRLGEDVKALTESLPVLPPKAVHVAAWDQGWVLAQGTWTVLGGEVAFPHQTTEISCDRSTMTCREATASVASSGGLTLMTSLYDIDHWDAQEIATKPSPGGCARYVMRINRLTKTVGGHRTKVSREGLCDSLGDQDVHSELADGLEVWKRLSEAKSRRTRDLMRLTPSARALLQPAP